MNEQDRYRGSNSQRNQSEGRGSSWSRDAQSALPDRGNPRAPAYGEERDQGSLQRSQVYGRYYNEDPFSSDRPFGEEDREYRAGVGGDARGRDNPGEWSGSAGRSGYYGEQAQTSDRDRSSGSTSSRDRYASSPSSRYDYGSGAGSRSNSGPYGFTYSSANRGGSYSGRGPKGYARSDERIREDVCERLSDNDEVDASEIEVQVNDRKVTLTGSVQNRRMKHIAEDLAEAVPGVDDVDNRVTVTKPLLRDMADRITGNEGERHYANTGTKNGPTDVSSSGMHSS